MSTNSNESFPRRVEGSSRQLNTRVSSWLRIMAFRIFGLESSEMKHMIHMMTMMGMMDGMTRMTPECPIICSSNHIDDASALLCPHAKGICQP